MKHLTLLFLVILNVSHFTLKANCLKFEGTRGENDACSNNFKYQVAILYKICHICGGGIIGDEFVVSAARCVINEKNNKFRRYNISIVAATFNVFSFGEFAVIVPVIKIYVLKTYNPINPKPNEHYRTEGDIAILKLKHGLGLSTNPKLNKLVLPQERFLYISERLIIVGHGDNEVSVKVIKYSKTIKYNEVKKSDGKLRFVEAVVVSNEYCQVFYDNPILASNICAAVVQRDDEVPEGVCSGDSGSPLIHNDDTVVGILYFSSLECREDEKPSVYTRVSDFLSFINNAMANKQISSMRVATWKTKVSCSLSCFGSSQFAED